MRLATLACLMLAACTPGPRLLDPPPEYDHPFTGELREHAVTYAGGPLLSWAKTNYVLDGFYGRPLRCDIFLPRAGDPGIDDGLRARLRRIETANCNGGVRADVNARRG